MKILFLDIDGVVNKCNKNGNPAKYPAPTFSELIRVLVKIWKVKGWTLESVGAFKISSMKFGLALSIITELYAHAPTEPEGMREVEEYLLKLL